MAKFPSAEWLQALMEKLNSDEKYAQVIIQRYVDYTSNPKIKINGVEHDWYEYKEQNSVDR